MEKYTQIKYYIGHVSDEEHRYKASSGGIGTLLQKYLLKTNQYGTSITFRFNEVKCMYEPIIIYKEEDVNICGSIYQDINILEFVRNHLADIKGGIVVSCPPCQVKAIKVLMIKSNIPHFIISYCCSGQTTIEGTWKYYDFLGIKKENVKNMQYRGNGWPSGMQIWLKNGEKKFYKNYTEPWVCIHKAGFYRPQRCWFCNLGTSFSSDVSLGDPWLPEYLNKEKKGRTVFITNTTKGESVIKYLISIKLIYSEEIDEETYRKAQKTTEYRRKRTKEDMKYASPKYRNTQVKFFRTIFTKTYFLMKAYILINNLIFKIAQKKR